MIRGYLSALHPFLKMLIILGLAFFSFLIVSILGVIVALLIFDSDVQGIMNALQDYTNPEIMGILKYLQILQSLGLFIIPSVILGILLFDNGMRGYGCIATKVSGSVIAVGVLVYFGFPLVNLLADWNSNLKLPPFLSGLEEAIRNMEDNAALLTDAFLQTTTVRGFLVNMVMIAILPAIGEELFFRGLIQKQFIQWTRKPWMGIILASAFFSFLHMQFYGFVPRFYLGIIFGLIYYWSGSIWLPILAHFLNNGTAVVIYFIFGIDAVESKFDSIGTTRGNWPILVISLLMIMSAMWYFWRNAQLKSALQIRDD